jgi:hypothetical protein
MAMKTKSFAKIKGEVESDESFVGGKANFMHRKRREEVIKGRGTVGKPSSTGSSAAARVNVEGIADQTKETLQARVHKHVEPGTSVFTDTLRSSKDSMTSTRTAWSIMAPPSTSMATSTRTAPRPFGA